MTSGAEAWPPGTPVGLPLPACPWVSLHPQTHLPSVASVCTESGVQCTYHSEGEWWAALLAPGVSGPHLRPGPLTAWLLSSPQPVSAPTTGGASVPGKSSTTRQTARGAASSPTVGLTAPSRGGSKTATLPPPPPKPPSPSLHRSVRQTGGVPTGWCRPPTPGPERQEGAGTGQRACPCAGQPAATAKLAGPVSPVMLSGLRHPAWGRGCEQRYPRLAPGERTTGSRLGSPCLDPLLSDRLASHQGQAPPRPNLF